jgi:predicted metal-binding protein
MSTKSASQAGPARLPDPRRYRELALAGGADTARLISVRKVVTAAWVRLKCQFGCSGFGKRLCCPPHTPTPEQMQRVLSAYRRAVIYSYPCSSAGYRRKQRRMHRLIAELERVAFLDGYYKAFGLGAGPCRLCAECNVTGRCEHPYEARPSMESCGIDVYATARGSGIPLEVVTRANASSRHINLLLLD